MDIAFLGNFDVSYSSESHHAASLESLGHTVVRLQEGKATGEEVLAAGLDSDMLVVVHTHRWHTPGLALTNVLEALKASGIPTVTYHLDLWLGLERQHDLDRDPFYRSIGHFFTADRLMADFFNSNTAVKGHYLPAGVFDQECYRAAPGERFDVAFVGSRGYHPEWSYRPRLIDWLDRNYGRRFRHYGGGGLGTVRGADLNQVYADARVVVGDSLCLGFDYPDYWSDRVYETLGRGGFLIHPHVPGMERTFTDGEHLVFYEYNTFTQLRELVDHYLGHPDEAEKIRQAGHELVKGAHTYRHRWATILDTVFA